MTTYTRYLSWPKRIWRPIKVTEWFFAPVEWLFLWGPISAAAIYRMVVYIVSGIPDPAFSYYGLKIDHLPYLSWGAWPWGAWTIFFFIFLALFVWVWIQLIRQPYHIGYKLGWFTLWGGLVLMMFSQW